MDASHPSPKHPQSCRCARASVPAATRPPPPRPLAAVTDVSPSPTPLSERGARPKSSGGASCSPGWCPVSLWSGPNGLRQ